MRDDSKLIAERGMSSKGQYGAGSGDGPSLKIVAPAQDLKVLKLNRHVDTVWGTSGSAALAAGVAAIFVGYEPLWQGDLECRLETNGHWALGVNFVQTRQSLAKVHINNGFHMGREDKTPYFMPPEKCGHVPKKAKGRDEL